MTADKSRSSLRQRAFTALAAAALALAAGTASAQGLFDFLFGGGMQRRAPASPPVRAYGPSFDEPSSRASESGRYTAYCVRLCDGRYFPVQRNGGANPAELCSAFCPAAQTKIFSGSGIDYAVASDGTRYERLKTAFAYRERVVPDCTCNGREPFGLARLDAKEDPTLRAGDVIATNEGLMAYSGSQSRGANFTPVQSYSSMSKEMRRKLSETKIRPMPQPRAAQTGATVGQGSRETPRRARSAR